MHKSMKKIITLVSTFLLLTIIGLVLPGASTQPAAAAESGSGMVDIPIPTVSPGLSINLVTGETSTTADTPYGWDVQISGSLVFSANTSRPAREAGLVSRVNRRVAGT